jgi:hypothetical protein
MLGTLLSGEAALPPILACSVLIELDHLPAEFDPPY